MSLSVPVCLLAAYAPGDEVLVLARVLGGLSAGMAFPTTLALITALWSGAVRTRSIALWSGIGGSISALGPLAGGALLVAALVLAINLAPVPGHGALVLGLAAVAVAAAAAFVIRQRRAANPLYDLHVAARRIFWVAALAGIIVFGSLMAAMFVGQQFLQNVLGYSTLQAGLSILPGAALLVLVAPVSAKLVTVHGSRVTLLLGYLCCLLGFAAMLLLWRQGTPYWQVGLGYALAGAGVGLAGTPASHSLTGSVPVQRAGMASGTADLQRDLGGAIMQSIFGALLTAGYAAAVSAAVAVAPDQALITEQVRGELTKSFAGAADTAQQYPRYSDQIIDAARAAFLAGDQWAYTAGIVAVLLGAALVCFAYPDRDGERRLLAAYHAEDRSRRAAAR